ncbi:MAG: DUF4340 domain-containing protein [Gemmatimonadota bacterium]
MSAKTLKWLGIATAALVAVWVLVSLVERGRASGTGAAPLEVAAIVEELNPDALVGVRIAGPGDTLEILRTPQGWTVDGYAADSASMSRLWDSVEKMEITGPVARNPANHERMGVSGSAAWKVVFRTDGDSVALLVGRSGTPFGSAYVRLPGADEVYLLTGGLRTVLTRRRDDWRNKRIAAADTSAVTRIEVTRGRDTYAVERSDSTWTLKDDGLSGAEEPADDDVVTRILQELAGLDATGFWSADDSVATLPEDGRILALDADGDTLLDVHFGSGGMDRWARVPGDSVIYRFPSWRLDRVAPEPGKVRAKEGEGS